MIIAAMVLVGLAGALLVVRLIIGPTVADRVVAADGLLVTAMCGVLLSSAHADSNIGLDTVLVVALLSFIATGVMARYIEQRGSR